MQVELFQPKPFLFDLDSGRNLLSQRPPTRRPTKELTGSLCLFARIGAPKDSRVGAQLIRLLVRQFNNRLGSNKAKSVCLLSNQLRDLLEGLLMLVITMPGCVTVRKVAYQCAIFSEVQAILIPQLSILTLNRLLNESDEYLADVCDMHIAPDTLSLAHLNSLAALNGNLG